MAQKGNGNSSPHLKNEIELATPKSERRELREAELLDLGRQESEMNLEHDPLRLLRETTTTRPRRRNMRDFNTKREERNMRANARQSHDAGIELLIEGVWPGTIGHQVNKFKRLIALHSRAIRRL